jgi:Zn-dependent M16 (insulinase) family peptidase
LDRLAKTEATLAAEDRARIVADALRLKAEQDAKQDLSLLPTLELSDIPMRLEDVPSRDASAGQARVEFYPQPTNGITYLDIRSDFATLTAEQKDLLPLFGRVLTQSGAAGQDYAEIAARVASYTGGVGAAGQVKSLAEGAINARLQGIRLLHTMRRLAKLGEG